MVTTRIGAQGIAGIENIAQISDNTNVTIIGISEIIELSDAEWESIATRSRELAEAEFGTERMASALRAVNALAQTRKHPH